MQQHQIKCRDDYPLCMHLVMHPLISSILIKVTVCLLISGIGHAGASALALHYVYS